MDYTKVLKVFVVVNWTDTFSGLHKKRQSTS